MRSSKSASSYRNHLRRQFCSSPRAFLTAVRAHTKLILCSEYISQHRSAKKQEQAFRKNPWHFSKSACCPSSQLMPTFSKYQARDHFSKSFSNSSTGYVSLPTWVLSLVPSPQMPDDFDLSPITPGHIRSLLKRCKHASAPGEDRITYSHLKHLPTCHHFLATLFKIFIGSQSSPPSWSKGKITLIHKSGDTGDLANYRPIILSPVIGKLFHKIIALRLEKFCLSNNVIDLSIQKGFLSGINGTMEHIFCHFHH